MKSDLISYFLFLIFFCLEVNKISCQPLKVIVHNFTHEEVLLNKAIKLLMDDDVKVMKKNWLL